MVPKKQPEKTERPVCHKEKDVVTLLCKTELLNWPGLQKPVSPLSPPVNETRIVQMIYDKVDLKAQILPNQYLMTNNHHAAKLHCWLVSLCRISIDKATSISNMVHATAHAHIYWIFTCFKPLFFFLDPTYTCFNLYYTILFTYVPS